MSALVIDVRKARPSDAGGIADVHAAAWREAYSGIIPALTLERMIARRGAPFWRDTARRRGMLVLEVGGRIAGYASFGPARLGGRSAQAELQELYLAPEYQGIGLGRRLFAGTLKTLRAQGYGRLLVRALADNERAVAFYRRRGGRVAARSDDPVGDRTLPCLWFEFRL